MRKFLSSILAVVMVLSSMAMVVSAETTGTITVYDANNEIVEGTYTTIDTAAAAAGVNGKIVLSAGIFEFNGRQTIQVEGVDLIGAGSDQTFIVPSTSYANASATNKKALLTIAVSNVEISGVTIDGSEYGDTVDASADFNVVRINDGDNVVLTNVVVTGSPRSLISIGTSSTNAVVSATGLYCYAETDKTFTDINGFGTGYADIDVENGTFYLGADSVVNGFICEGNNGNFQNNCESNHYELRFRPIQILPIYKYVTATAKHYVDTYNDASLASDDEGKYINALSYNQASIETMATNVANDIENDRETAEGLYEMLNTAVEDYNISALTDARDTLATALGN